MATAVVLIAGTSLMMVSQATVTDSEKSQAEHQKQVLAREIARSGYNAALQEANATVEGGGFSSLADVVPAVRSRLQSVFGGADGRDYQGGTLTVEVEDLDATNGLYRIIATGTYDDQSYEIGSQQTAALAALHRGVEPAFHRHQ